MEASLPANVSQVAVRFSLKSILGIDTPGQQFTALVELQLRMPAAFHARLMDNEPVEREYGRLYEFYNLQETIELNEYWSKLGDSEMRLRVVLKVGCTYHAPPALPYMYCSRS